MKGTWVQKWCEENRGSISTPKKKMHQLSLGKKLTAETSVESFCTEFLVKRKLPLVCRRVIISMLRVPTQQYGGKDEPGDKKSVQMTFV